jgi:hypothetical protein
MSIWTSITMKMSFVVVPSGTDPEGSTTKAIFVVILFQSSTVLSRNKMLSDDMGGCPPITEGIRNAEQFACKIPLFSIY